MKATSISLTAGRLITLLALASSPLAASVYEWGDMPCYTKVLTIEEIYEVYYYGELLWTSSEYFSVGVEYMQPYHVEDRVEYPGGAETLYWRYELFAYDYDFHEGYYFSDVLVTDPGAWSPEPSTVPMGTNFPQTRTIWEYIRKGWENECGQYDVTAGWEQRSEGRTAEGTMVVIIAPTGPILIGQRVTLTLTAPANASNISWQIPGVTFDDYQANASTGTLQPLSSPELNSSSVTFYWADAGDGRTANCSFTFNGQQHVGSISLDVKSPYFEWFSHSSGSDTDYIQLPTGIMEFRPDDYTYANAFVGESGDSGKWCYVQLLDESKYRIHESGQSEVGKIDADGWVLDSTFPYEPVTGEWQVGETHPFWDLPSQAAYPDHTAQGLYVEFRLYVMYMPPGADSRWCLLAGSTGGGGMTPIAQRVLGNLPIKEYR